jgi:hypothetical protein
MSEKSTPDVFLKKVQLRKKSTNSNKNRSMAVVDVAHKDSDSSDRQNAAADSSVDEEKADTHVERLARCRFYETVSAGIYYM